MRPVQDLGPYRVQQIRLMQQHQQQQEQRRHVPQQQQRPSDFNEQPVSRTYQYRKVNRRCSFRLPLHPNAHTIFHRASPFPVRF